MASINSRLPVGSVQAVQEIAANSAGYVAIGDIARMLGCSIQSVRLWCKAGKLPFVITHSGHRRFVPSAVLKAMGYLSDVEASKHDKKAAIYCRTSSKSQIESLKTQVADVRKEAAKRENCRESEILVYQECVSSFGNREVLHSLLDAAIDGKIHTVYVSYRDRLARIAGQLHTILHILNRYGVKVVYIYTAPPSSDEKELADEIVEFLTVYVNRNSAKKSKQRCELTLPADALGEAAKMLDDGISYPNVVKHLNDSGFRFSNSMGETKPVNEYTLRNKIKQLRKIGFAETDNSSLDKWFKACCKKSDDTTFSAELYNSYVQFCEARKLPQKQLYQFQAWLSDSMGFEKYHLKNKRHLRRSAYKVQLV